ncbi:substrate-binding periplasmic protein [Litoribrevibacter albus]|nr:transporter substrate-binding domain-containing protein [Litoribrevibacter albus]
MKNISHIQTLVGLWLLMIVSIIQPCYSQSLSIPSPQSKRLQLVTLEYPPYEYSEDNQVKGVAVNLVSDVFKTMGHDISIEILPWARAINSIKLGQADAIFTAFHTKERAAFADYSKEVLIHQEISLFALEKSPLTFHGDLTTIGQYQIGVIRKMSYGKKFDQAVIDNIIQYTQSTSSLEQNIEKLLSGRIDFVVSNKLGALDTLNKMNKRALIRVLSPPLESTPSYIAFSKQRNLTHIRDAFDRHLKQLKQTGRYQEIIDEYFQ